MFVFQNYYGCKVVRHDPTGELAEFYRQLTGKEPMQINPLPGVLAERQGKVRTIIRQMAQDGQKIMAIKLVRAISGWSLKESKDWVEPVVEIG